jgi:hypothetical protein
MQSLYANTLDPLFNYMAAPVNPMLEFAGGTGLLNVQTAQPEPYRIELSNMLPSRP